MSAIIKNRFRIQNAKDFLENLVGHPRTNIVGNTINLVGATEAERVENLKIAIGSHVTDRNLYLFVGRSRAWPTDLLAGTSDLSPPLARDTIEAEYRIWDAMLGLKRVTAPFSSLVIPRFNWDATGETIYKPYDNNDADLFNHPTTASIADGNINGYTAGSFFILTDEFHVFKCLDNNLSSKSTIKPQKPLSAPFTFEGADGYRWKYMTTVTPGQVVKFLTERWIPIRKLKEDDGSTQWLVQQAATSATIEGFIIDNAGSGYQYVHSGTLVSGAGLTAVLAVGASAVDNVYNGAQIHIISGTGVGTIRDIVSYVGATNTITVDTAMTVDATSVYEVTPKLTITGNGTGATGRVIVETAPGPQQHKIKKIVLSSAGSGYSFVAVTITGSGGTGAVVRAQIAQIGGHGSDIEKELGAFFAMLNVRLEYQEGAGDFPLSNDYRQIGMIRDVKNLNGSLATDDTRIATKRLILTGVVDGLGGPFAPDEDVVCTLGLNVATVKVIDFVSTGPGTGTLSFFQDPTTGYNILLDAMTAVGLTSGATATVAAAGVVLEEVQKFSGEIIYIEQRRPVLRAPDQIEDIKAILEF